MQRERIKDDGKERKLSIRDVNTIRWSETYVNRWCSLPGNAWSEAYSPIARDHEEATGGRYVPVRLESRHLTDSRFCPSGSHGPLARQLGVKRAADP